MNKLVKISVVVLSTSILVSCMKDPNSPGYEYMPDMYRSGAVEAYVDYNQPDRYSAMLPPAHTIPFSNDAKKAWFMFPYEVPNTPEGYELAGAKVKSPIPYSDAVKEEGKVLYEKFCTPCHGENGDGQGDLVNNGKINGVPAYNTGAIKELPEGKMFHSITYGKGIMGSHAGQLNKEERWKVIQYVRFLQNDKKSPVAETETNNEQQ